MSNKSINLEPLSYRIAAIVAGGAAIALLVLSANWFFANAIAGNAEETEIASFAVDMAPSDPQTHNRKALLLEKSFREGDQKEALKEAEIAVSLSPHDYVLWQTVARLRERTGDVKGAEKALRKAFELAPNNAAVQWALGNVLMRQENYPESFGLVRKAVEGDNRFAGPAASIAWDIFEGDVVRVQGVIGKSPAAVSALALYLGRLNRFDEAYEIWKTNPKDKRDDVFLADTRTLLGQFVGGKKYGLALAVSSELIKEKSLVPKLNTVTNAGFEVDIARDLPGTFDWSIQKGTKPSIGMSISERLDGKKSLALLFDGGPSKEFRTVSQTVAVTGGRNFTFFASYKSNLTGNSTVYWAVTDSVSGTLLVSTEEVAQASNGWKELSAEFSVPEDSDGITVTLLRAPCKDTACPLSGAVWFDRIGIK